MIERYTLEQLAVDETPDLFGDVRWVDEARCVASRIAQVRGQVTADDLRLWADATGNYPKHPNAWGAVFMTEAWEQVSTQRSTTKTNRGRRVAVWRLRSTT